MVKNEKVVFTDAYTKAWEPSGKPFMTAIVTFEDEGGKTRYTARALHWTAEDAKTHEEMGFHEGWGLCADQLAALAKRSSASPRSTAAPSRGGPPSPRIHRPHSAIPKGSAMDTHVQPPSKSARWTGYVISGLVILFLLFDGGIKLVPLEIVTQTSGEIGLPTDPSFARLLGILTLIGVVLYAMPQTAVLGAILLTGYMGGAIATHLRIDSPLFSHTLFGVYLGLLIWGGLYLREPRLRALIPFRR